MTDPTKPLSFRYIWNSITFFTSTSAQSAGEGVGKGVTLMDCKVTSITKDDGVGVFAVALVADGTGGVFADDVFFAFVLGDTFFEFVPFFFDFSHCYFKDFSGYLVSFEVVFFPSFIVLL